LSTILGFANRFANKLFPYKTKIQFISDKIPVVTRQQNSFKTHRKQARFEIHTRGVCGSNLESPTFREKSAVLDDISLRELVIELLGADGVRKVIKRTKPTSQLFSKCYTMLSTCRPARQVYENKRVLEKFGP
jgi:hypothetical protein